MTPFTTLISSDQLEPLLSDRSLLVVDCRFDLNDTASGEAAYADAHVPGAVYAHLDRDLSGQKTGLNGRHPLPAVGAAADTFGRFGIDDTIQVVVYDQDTGSLASRLWWMLRWLGHDRVAVLDGGFVKWTAEGRPVRRGVEVRAPRVFAARPRSDMIATADDVAARAAASDWRVIDARAPERYRGEVEPIDRVPGHVPGAINVPYLGNIAADGTFRRSEELGARFRDALAGVKPDHAICYCGSGVTACHNLLALALIGNLDAKLYVGSWSEWSADASRPVASVEEDR